MASATKVESRLESRVLAQFDSLVRKGEIFWEPTEEIKCEQDPFNVYFRVSAITASKPYNPADKSRKPGFLDDDPEFTLDMIEPAHKLILNKFCWLRPQMILHTREFQSQTDLLYEPDFVASLNVLEQLGDRYMVIFNGGPDAGSSVAHKHLQVFLRPEWATIADDMVSGSSKAKPPFAHVLRPVTKHLSPQDLCRLYNDACTELNISSGTAQSFILTHDWMLLMPRACATIQGEINDAPLQGGANAMIGMLWLKSENQLKNWKSYGPMKALESFGKP